MGLTKYTHRLLDHNKVTQKDFFVETAHRKSKGVLILRTISHHNTISRHNQRTDTTAQLYEFDASPETVIEVVLNLRRNVPYFYDTLWVGKFTLVSALILCLKQPWWSVALAHTITRGASASKPAHRRHPHTMGNAACTWFGINSPGGQVVSTTTNSVSVSDFKVSTSTHGLP